MFMRWTRLVTRELRTYYPESIIKQRVQSVLLEGKEQYDCVAKNLQLSFSWSLSLVVGHPGYHGKCRMLLFVPALKQTQFDKIILTHQ